MLNYQRVRLACFSGKRNGGLETVANLGKKSRSFEEFLADFHFDEMLAVEKLGPYNPVAFVGFFTLWKNINRIYLP